MLDAVSITHTHGEELWPEKLDPEQSKLRVLAHLPSLRPGRYGMCLSCPSFQAENESLTVRYVPTRFWLARNQIRTMASPSTLENPPRFGRPTGWLASLWQWLISSPRRV